MLLLVQQGQQQDMGSGSWIFTIEMLVVGVLPAEFVVSGALWLSAVGSMFQNQSSLLALSPANRFDSAWLE